MFIIMYSEINKVPHQLLDQCDVLTIDEVFTIKSFLIYCYSTLSSAKLHNALETVKLKNFLIKYFIKFSYTKEKYFIDYVVFILHYWSAQNIKFLVLFLI